MKTLLAIAVLLVLSLPMFGQESGKRKKPTTTLVPTFVGDGITDNSAAFAAATGRVELSPGTYLCTANVVLMNAVTFVGASPNATIIQVIAGSGPAFLLGANGIGFENLGFAAQGVRTSGALVRVDTVQQTYFSNVGFSGGYTSVEVNASIGTRLTHCDFGAFTHEGLLVTDGNDCYVDHCIMFGSITAVAGIEFRSGSALWIDSSDIIYIRAGAGLLIAPGSGKIVEDLYCANSHFDNSQTGIQITPAAGGTVVGLFFMNSAGCAGLGDGLDIGIPGGGVVDGVSFTGGRFNLNAQSGAVVQNATNVGFNGVAFGRNSVPQAGPLGVCGTKPGLHIMGTASHIIVQGCRSRPQEANLYIGPCFQSYGLLIDLGATYCNVTGNDFTGNVVSMLNGAGTATNIIANNLV